MSLLNYVRSTVYTNGHTKSEQTGKKYDATTLESQSLHIK